MANYIIIGGDGKEYGPVSGEQLRQWIADGRATQARRCGPKAPRDGSRCPRFRSLPPG